MQEQTNLTQLIESLRQQLPLLEERYRVESLGVFGSYVRHEQRPDSDLDVLVTFREAPSLLKFIELENYLSGVLGVKIDLVMKDALKPHIGQHILNEAPCSSMTSKRVYPDYLEDIADAADKIAQFIEGMTYGQFVKDAKMKSVCMERRA